MGGRGVDIPKDLFIGLFNNAEQNSYFEILIECVWGIDRRGRRPVALQSLLNLKKGTTTFNFQSNELLSKFLQLLQYEVPRLGRIN